jgi:hypothetical protein
LHIRYLQSLNSVCICSSIDCVNSIIYSFSHFLHFVFTIHSICTVSMPVADDLSDARETTLSTTLAVSLFSSEPQSQVCCSRIFLYNRFQYICCSAFFMICTDIHIRRIYLVHNTTINYYKQYHHKLLFSIINISRSMY